MAERLITVITQDRVPDLLSDVDEATVRTRWEVQTHDGRYETTLLVDVNESEKVMDALHGRFEGDDGYRLMLIEIQASLPRPDQEEDDEKDGASASADGKNDAPPDRSTRISREELYFDLVESCKVSPQYLVMVALATIVAAGGMLRDNVAVIIGAMVIAPLLAPNIALSLATTLADPKLARKALASGGAGLAVAAGLSAAMGLVLPVSLQNPQLLNRAMVNFADVALAVAAGAAGALAFTSGVAGGVIGVMVAVALLPPIVAAGLLFASGHTVAGSGAAILVGVNLIGINLAGVLTFLLQGVTPHGWREERASRRATGLAIAIWFVLLSALVALIFIRGPLDL